MYANLDGFVFALGVAGRFNILGRVNFPKSEDREPKFSVAAKTSTPHICADVYVDNCRRQATRMVAVVRFRQFLLTGESENEKLRTPLSTMSVLVRPPQLQYVAHKYSG